MKSSAWRQRRRNRRCLGGDLGAKTRVLPAPPKIIGSPTPTSSRMPKAKTPAISDISTPPGSYELALAELEALAVSMESGQLPLGEMMNGYRRASFLLEFCRQQLDAVEAQIRALDDGQAKPWAQD